MIVNTEAQKAFAKLLTRGADLQTPLKDIGQAIKESSRLRFLESKAPSGKAWAPLSPVTLALRRQGKRKGAGSKPLLNTGALRNSIMFRLGGTFVEIGSPEAKAKTHQFGARVGQYGRYTQLWRSKKYGRKTFLGSSGSKRGHPIPWGNVPARPFVGVSAKDRAEIVNILQSHLLAS
jgi:phage gpG-like protein